MITKTQALNENIFHYGNCLAYYQLVYTKIGVVGTSLLAPHYFNVWIETSQEIKEKRIELRPTMLLSHRNAEDFHVPSECPILINAEKRNKAERIL